MAEVQVPLAVDGNGCVWLREQLPNISLNGELDFGLGTRLFNRAGSCFEDDTKNLHRDDLQ
jgi:hypothetical protein